MRARTASGSSPRRSSRCSRPSCRRRTPARRCRGTATGSRARAGRARRRRPARRRRRRGSARSRRRRDVVRRDPDAFRARSADRRRAGARGGRDRRARMRCRRPRSRTPGTGFWAGNCAAGRRSPASTAGCPAGSHAAGADVQAEDRRRRARASTATDREMSPGRRWHGPTMPPPEAALDRVGAAEVPAEDRDAQRIDAVAEQARSPPGAASAPRRRRRSRRRSRPRRGCA